MQMAAIYARVSSEQQREAHTIGSQTTALIEFAKTLDLEVPTAWIFEDDGYSGATLERPGLERVRDLAAEGQIQAVLVYAPDRLSRKYAYQILLIEELAREGVETRFLNAPQSTTAEDQLLVQFQGMIAEYERAQILERSRRWKRHRARAGIEPGQLTLHADRGGAMRSKPVALLLADLGVVKTHSRPYVSNDNPFSEAHFRTLKYCPQFPDRFGSIEDGRAFGQEFFRWYNQDHRHSGLGFLTPAVVHFGHAEVVCAHRNRVLAAAGTPSFVIRIAVRTSSLQLACVSSASASPVEKTVLFVDRRSCRVGRWQRGRWRLRSSWPSPRKRTMATPVRATWVRVAPVIT
jgi:DNA invertase Pin-like site-specific DNA recombinase